MKGLKQAKSRNVNSNPRTCPKPNDQPLVVLDEEIKLKETEELVKQIEIEISKKKKHKKQ